MPASRPSIRFRTSYSVVTTRMLEWNNSTGVQDAARMFQQATPQGLVSGMIFIASFPIICVYPFLQRYFVTGLTIGSVKG